MELRDRTTLDKNALELGTSFAPKFDENGLLPCIAQHADTGDVLMFAFMNKESLQKTLQTGEVHYWSRSRGKLWKKGESSGMVQQVRGLYVDCDQDCLIAKVVIGDPAPPTSTPQAACHTGYKSCFYRKIRPDGSLEFAESHKAFDPDKVYG